MFHDKAAEAKFAELVTQFGIRTCFETGSDIGHGTTHIAKYCKAVVSIELDRGRFDRSCRTVEEAGFCLVAEGPQDRVYMRDDCIVSMINASSADGLRALLVLSRACFSLLRGPFCFYLDAHGGEYWPLLDELKVIADAGIKDCVIIFHDAKVPGKPWGFDSYGGHDLDYEYVREALAKINPGFKIFYNERCEQQPGLEERGIMYATP